MGKLGSLKNSGFYKLKFFITPEEFKSILQIFEQNKCHFHLTNYAQTEHNLIQVHEAYIAYYQYFTTNEKMVDRYPFFVYSISTMVDQEKTGLFARNEGIAFPYYSQWAEDELPYLLFSLPKGVQVNLEDEQGKYFIYEDIRHSRPLTYALFNEITSYMKKHTKLLRFSALQSDAMIEQKPSVRISDGAIQELKASWIVEKYGLIIDR